MMASLTLRGFSLEEFRRYHPGGFLGRKLTRVADVMTPVEALPWLGPDSSVWEVLEAISLEAGASGVVSERPPGGAEVAVAETGLISDGDIRRAVRERGTFTTRTAGTMMTRHPTAISQDALMVEALRLMEANRFSFLLCRDDAGRLTGAVQMHISSPAISTSPCAPTACPIPHPDRTPREPAFLTPARVLDAGPRS